MLSIPLPQSPKVTLEEENRAVVVIEGLYPGYGLTVGNALRRVLLSSLPGAAVTSFTIKGVNHEFSTIPGVLEDVVEISLNLKRLRLRMFTEESQQLMLSVKGEREVKAKDITKNSQVEIINPDLHIATLTTKNAEFELELKVEGGIGYSQVEARQKEKLPIGMIAVDAMFSPVRKVNFEVENMRVGDRTDFNRLRLHVETDGTLAPLEALTEASKLLIDHFEIVKATPSERA
ncbi:MAG: DNA-directed RNA polymerase subunit alpha, partial [Parcubacteria group bacterium]|nr:DNA-directed RNA polymerase subunit alpha [Parcubacteria group bacterium]